MVRRGFSKQIVSTGPAPIFKKRNTTGDIALATNTSGTFSSITCRETGTVYSVKISCFGRQDAEVTGDTQVVDLYCHVKNPAGAAVVDLSVASQVDGLNGFFVGSLPVHTLSDGDMGISWINEKFRFRRLVDEGDLLELIGRNHLVSGGARTVRLFFTLSWVIRTR